MSPTARRAIVAVLALLVWLAPGHARSEEWDPFPTLPAGEHAALGRGVDLRMLPTLRSCLEPTSAVGAHYFAVVVNITDGRGSPSPAANDAVAYVDALYRAYQPQGRLDPDKHVLIALGLSNRAVAIHAGALWVNFGFERATITQTINESEFRTYARGGDYALAVCRLALAVDVKLADLARRAEARLKAVAADVASARASIAQLSKAGAALAAPWPKLAAAWDADLHEATKHADAASAPGASLAAAERDASAARALLSRLADRQRDVELAKQRLSAIRTDLEADRERVIARTSKTFGATRITSGLIDECLGLATSIEAGYADGKETARPVDELDHCRQRGANAASRAESDYRFERRVVPAIFAAILAAAFLVWAGRRRARRAMAAIDARQELDAWSRAMEQASARLLDLEQHHPAYFVPGATRWSGASKKHDQAAADAVNRAFLFYAKAQELLAAARREADGAGPLSVAPFHEALRLLRDAKVVFETGEAETRRRIFLPLSKRYEGTARAVLHELDRAYEEAVKLLDHIAALASSSAKHTDDAARAAADALAACKEREDLALPVAHLAERLRPALDRQREASAAALTDPEGSMAILAAAAPDLAEVARLARVGNEAIRRLRGPLFDRGRAIDRDLARLRAEGFRLDEPGLAADARLARARREIDEAIALVARGREEEGALRAAQIDADLQQLERDLASTEQARAEVPRELDAILAAEQGLRARIPAAEERLRELAAEHARAAFAIESDNLDELREVLASLARFHEHVRAEHAAERYLSAIEDVRTMRSLLSAGDELLVEIDAIRARLDAARRSSNAAAARCAKLAAALDAEAPEILPGVGAMLRRRIEAAKARARDVGAEASAARPHWASLDEQLNAAERELAACLDLARREIASLARAREIAIALDRELSQIAREVERETRDRPHVARAVAHVKAQIDAWRQRFDDPSLSGSQCLEHGDDARRAVERVRSMWRTEVDLIRTIEAEMSAARGELGELGGRYFGQGIAPQLDRTQRRLASAEAAIAAQDLDRAIALIAEGRQHASEERRRCAREAEEAAEAERRRLAAATAMSTPSPSLWSAASSSSSSSSSSFWDSSSSSSSSSSSWDSSSSSSSSSSSGSSFDSSSSGGSSFGDSSSGGSSW